MEANKWRQGWPRQAANGKHFESEVVEPSPGADLAKWGVGGCILAK